MGSKQLVAAVALLGAGVVPARAQGVRPAWPAIDSVFSTYSSRPGPGCAVAVASHDTVVYEHGYGLAMLEWSVPIDGATVFELGSTSKQFTAFSILLLEKEGKLSLDDDIRKWIPELPRYRKAITLSHLLHHTSGIRDYDPLLVYRGTRYHDVATNADILEMLSLQKGLNFPTGSRWQYSNSNYVLLALVVERASGRSLREFLTRRIFEPLGMTGTRLRVDHTEVIPHRARGYEPASDSTWSVDDSNWEETGDGTIQSSVRDMIRWADNYRTGTVGGQDVVKKMVQVGKLDDGTPVTYAFGLVVDRWRGLDRVAHGGSWAGYRTELLRFPEPALSIVTICNLGSTDPSALSRVVAERVLGSRLEAGPVPAVQGHGGPRTRNLAGLAGTYWSDAEDQALVLSTRDSTLIVTLPGRATLPLAETGENTFTIPRANYVLTFRGPAEGKRALTVRMEDRDVPFARVAAPDTSIAALRRLTGSFRSAELKGAVWTVAIHDGRLTLRSAVATAAAPLTPLAPDVWNGVMFDDPVTLRFVRSSAGAVVGLTASGFALRGLAFRKER